jgi:hypothetical protein
LTGRAAERPASTRQALRLVAMAAAIAGGLALGWAASGQALGWAVSGPMAVVGSLAVLVAASNGFSKAYSP